MPNARVQEMIRLYVENGFSYQQIADEYGITRQRVGQLLAPFDLAPEQVSVRKAQRVQMLQEAHNRITSGASTLAKEADDLGYKPGALGTAMRREGLYLPLPVPEHGTYRRYRRGCKCSECRRANSAHHSALMEKEAPNHGTQSGYSNYGCRCVPCREAARVAARDRRAQRRRKMEVPT